MTIVEKNQIDAYQTELENLLINAVDGGASVGFIPPLSRTTAYDYWKSVQEALVEGTHRLFLAMEEERVVGAVQLGLSGEENGDHRCELKKLFVHSQFRGKGIGKKLLIHAEEQAHVLGRKLIILDTRKGDLASNLYKKMGYQAFGEVPGYAKNQDGSLQTTIFFFKTLE